MKPQHGFSLIPRPGSLGLSSTRRGYSAGPLGEHLPLLPQHRLPVALTPARRAGQGSGQRGVDAEAVRADARRVAPPSSPAEYSTNRANPAGGSVKIHAAASSTATLHSLQWRKPRSTHKSAFLDVPSRGVWE